MPAAKIKDDAHRHVDNLEDEATWDDLLYEIYLRQAIERGMADSDAGRTMPIGEVRARYGLVP